MRCNYLIYCLMQTSKSIVEPDPDMFKNMETAYLKGIESGYNSDKIDNSSPDSNIRTNSPGMRVDDSGIPSPVIGVLSMSPASPENSPASSETNVDMGSPLCGNNSPNEE